MTMKEEIQELRDRIDKLEEDSKITTLTLGVAAVAFKSLKDQYIHDHPVRPREGEEMIIPDYVPVGRAAKTSKLDIEAIRDQVNEDLGLPKTKKR